MESRRIFIKRSGGTLLSAALLASPAAFPVRLFSGPGNRTDKMRIGVIGAENSHTIAMGKLFNIDKKFPGIEIIYVWGETEEFAVKAMKEGNIPEMVTDPIDMLGKIDALVVDHRHPRYHLEAATPFVEAGIPTFIDKPFCYRVSEGKEFLAMAKEIGTPVTSFSSILQSDATFDINEQLESMPEIGHIVSMGPADIESVYGGIFFYGVHLVEPALYWFGENVKMAKVSRNGKNATASLGYEDGKLITLIFNEFYYGWDTYVETREGIRKLESRVSESDPPRHYADMVEMFRTGKEPRSHQSILAGVAVLEALEKSVVSGDWEEVPATGD
jgi:predicted dehydrogenase